MHVWSMIGTGKWELAFYTHYFSSALLVNKLCMTQVLSYGGEGYWIDSSKLDDYWPFILQVTMINVKPGL